MSRRAPSRRGILGSGASLLLLAAAAAGASKAEEIDGELLRLCAVYQRLQVRIDGIAAEWDAVLDLTMEQDREFMRRMQDLQGEQADLHDEIEGIGAATPEGITAKARVLEASLREAIDTDGCFSDSCQSLAWSLLQDILGSPGWAT